MLNVQQIEALRKTNPQLYETLKRLAAASLGPNQGWSLDNQVTDGTNYSRVVSSALTGGQVDPTKTGVLMKGSVPPTWSGSLTYTSTTSSVTWSWAALTVSRADGTSTTVPNGSITAAGLTPGTTYYFYPFWDDVASVIGWVGSPPNYSGTTANSTKTNAAAQQQSLQGRIPLSQGAMVAATTTSGTGGGSGGGSGSCLRKGTVVLTKERGTVTIETCTVGEHLLCPSAVGAISMGRAGRGPMEAWTRIQRLELRDAGTFIRLHFSNAESLDVTPHHVFTLADGSPMRAERLCLCDILVGRFGRLTLEKIEAIFDESQKVTVSCEPTHQFFAGRLSATVLTHNYTYSS
jgi:hypothetical protein